jgi:transposase
MKRSRPRATRSLSSPEFQAEVVARFVTSGQSIAEIANELNLTESTVREWVRRASVEAVSAKAPPEDWAADPVTSADDLRQVTAEAATRAQLETELAAAAEAVAQAESKAEKATKALARAKANAAKAVAQAESAAAEVKAAARDEIAAAYAAAVEAIVAAEVSAAETAAQAESAAASAMAQAAARFESLLAQAEGVAREEAEAAAHAKVAAADAQARLEMAQTEALALREAAARSEAFAHAEAARIEGWAEAGTADQPEADSEAVARAEIAELVSGWEPVEVWVQAIGRTVAEARRTALDTLGVEETEAEFEILSKSRLIPGRVRIRARIRVHEGSRSS